MRKIIHREVPSFIGITTILVIAFMIWAIIWIGDRGMNDDFQTSERNIFRSL